MSFNDNIIFNRYLENIGLFIEKQNILNEDYNINNLNISQKINDINNKNILYYLFFIIIIFLFIDKIKISLNHIFSLIITMVLIYYLLNHNLIIKKIIIVLKINK